MRIIKTLCMGLVGGFLLTACENENFVQDLVPEGAMVYISPETEDTGLVNFLNPDDSRLRFTVSMTDEKGRDLEFAPVESIDVTVTYTDASTGAEHKEIVQNITTWPQTFDLTVNDLISLFPDNVLTRETLGLGDGFYFTADFRMEDGRFLSGWSPALLDNSPESIYRVFINYPVACPSDLAGTYLAECINCPNGEVASQAVTVSEVSSGVYTISDITMDIFGGGFAVAYNFTDVCNELSVASASRDYGDQISLEVLGGTAYDPDTGVITFDLQYASVSCCGLAGLQVSYTLTPQN
uniref:DUF4249 family protein n=1 Tax=Roseihalotalea indica TaxID=2867963 RepID=A0AA49GLH4_9BACT|nr:hypothetical protein K4G66_20560 [Tunicatimonas sp. TK19036]